MSIRLTNKDLWLLRNNFSVIASCGYCELQSLLKLSMEFCEERDNKARNASYEERKQILSEVERELQKLVKEFVENKKK